MSDDLISRQAVQTYIAEYLSQYLYEDVRQAVEVIDAYIGDMPSVTPTQKCVENALGALVIEDIKAEINEGIEKYKHKDKAVMYGFMCALYIIDKHIEGWDKE